ncbi:hypothetical protein [Sulfolobus super-elliptical virus]|nr:hypothetical protein [Sulfolobus super-elliptical virus]
MRKAIALLILSIFILYIIGINGVTAYALFQSEEYNLYKEGVVMVYNPLGNDVGTAFFINSHYLITANHVVENSSKIYAIRGDQIYPLKLIYANSTYDFAILYLNASIQYYAFPLALPQVGESVSVLGYPGINYFILNLAEFSPTLALEVYSNQPSYSQGYIGDIFNNTLIQFTAPVDEGDSGGPIIAGGSVVGYVDFALPPGTFGSVTAYFYGFSISAVIPILNSMHIQYFLTPYGLNVEDVLIGLGVFIILIIVIVAVSRR